LKILVLSDIHSNIFALEAVWKKEGDCDLILCAGDLVDYGPYPREVIGWVREHAVRCVQGNHDAWVALNFRNGNTLEKVPAVERGWVNLTAGLLKEEDAWLLENLPRSLAFELDGITYGMVHLYRDYNEIVSLHAFKQFRAETFDHAIPTNISRLIMGHTHRQSIRYLSDEYFWLNPGSASYRRRDDPDQAAHYATIIDGKISLKRLEYDITPLYRFVQKISLKESEMEVANFFFGPR
jgi:putative phosphoesterase